MRFVLATSLLLTSSLVAQEPRKVALDTVAPALSHSWDAYRLATMPAAPTESLPKLAKAGTVPTAKLAYMVWRIDPGNDTIKFARSTDGGVTWASRVLVAMPGAETIADMQIGCEGHDVFVAWLDNRAGHNALYNVYMAGSSDQGLTWSSPVLINTVSSKAGDKINFYPVLVQMSVTRDPTSKKARAHVAFEYGDNRTMHPQYQGTEAPHYVAVELVSGVPTVVVTEKDVSTVPAGKNKDIDNVAIYANGSIVMAYWRNDRNTYKGRGTSFNQVFGNFSADGGKTWGRDYLLGTGKDPLINGVTGLSNADPGGTNMGSSGARLYYVWKDRSHNVSVAPAVGADERLILAMSFNLGRTWSQKVLTTFGPGLADIDEVTLLVEGSRVVVVCTSDERGRHKAVPNMKGTLTNTPADRTTKADNQGNGNYGDQVQIFLSNDAGRTFTSSWLSENSIDDGTVKATQGVVSGSGPFKAKGTNLRYSKNVQAAMRGDVVHVCWEEHWYSATGANQANIFQGEDLVMISSYDGGKTWGPTRNVTKVAGEARGYQTANGKNGDIDSPRMVINANGQAIVGLRMMDIHGGSKPDLPYAVMRSAVEIETKFQGATGLDMRNIPASEAGFLALVIGTGNAAATPWVVPGLFGNLGFEPNFVPDALTNLMLSVIPVFVGVVPPGGGTVKFPAAPDLKGQAFVVGLTLDLKTGSWASYTARGRY